MPAPKPKPESALDEDDYVDLKRTEINLRHRMQMRREKNALYQDILDKKSNNKILKAWPVGELEEGTDV